MVIEPSGYQQIGVLRWALPGLLIAVLSLQTGCMHKGQPLVAERSPVLSGQSQRDYVVQQGDSIYSIAWRYELDHLGLARANGIKPPFVIYPGQRLRLLTQLPRSERVRGSAKPQAAKPQDKVAATPPRPASRPSPALQWVWPLTAKPSVEFGRGSKGLDFRLVSASANTKAAAAGEVVYAGTGIGGYERLVIIKHSASMLSAYSFDGQLQVRERQQVSAGSVIANIRRRGPTQQALHFELRREGKPINPRQFLQ